MFLLKVMTSTWRFRVSWKALLRRRSLTKVLLLVTSMLILIKKYHLGILMNDHQLCAVDLLPCFNIHFTYERDDGLACSWPDHILTNCHIVDNISSIMCIHSHDNFSDHVPSFLSLAYPYLMWAVLTRLVRMVILSFMTMLTGVKLTLPQLTLTRFVFRQVYPLFQMGCKIACTFCIRTGTNLIQICTQKHNGTFWQRVWYRTVNRICISSAVFYQFSDKNSPKTC